MKAAMVSIPSRTLSRQASGAGLGAELIAAGGGPSVLISPISAGPTLTESGPPISARIWVYARTGFRDAGAAGGRSRVGAGWDPCAPGGAPRGRERDRSG